MSLFNERSSTVKLHHLVSLAVALLATWDLGPASAQPPPPGMPLPGGFPMIVVVDEFCSGSWSEDGGNTFQPLPCFLEEDPFSHLVVPCFVLPQLVFTGDVVAFEPPNPQRFSDMLRFPNIFGDGTTDRMYFFSDRDPEDPNPPDSDVGIPPPLPPTVLVPEQGIPEVFDFFVHSTSLALYLAISDFPMPSAPDPGLKKLVEFLLSRPQPTLIQQ
jgi:hypothetical protein